MSSRGKRGAASGEQTGGGPPGRASGRQHARPCLPAPGYCACLRRLPAESPSALCPRRLPPPCPASPHRNLEITPLEDDKTGGCGRQALLAAACLVLPAACCLPLLLRRPTPHAAASPLPSPAPLALAAAPTPAGSLTPTSRPCPLPEASWLTWRCRQEGAGRGRRWVEAAAGRGRACSAVPRRLHPLGAASRRPEGRPVPLACPPAAGHPHLVGRLLGEGRGRFGRFGATPAAAAALLVPSSRLPPPALRRPLRVLTPTCAPPHACALLAPQNEHCYGTGTTPQQVWGHRLQAALGQRRLAGGG